MKSVLNLIFNWSKVHYLSILIFLAFILIYSFTMLDEPGGRINFGDSIKWQYLHKVNGLPHSTGYPQMALLSELFSRIIFFLPEFQRITFISIFFGALSITVFYGLVCLLTSNKWGAIIASVFFGLTVTFWTLSTEPEVYTLNIFYLLCIIYFFIKYQKTKTNKYFLIGSAFYAFSFGNHLSMITILPAIVYVVLATDFKNAFTKKNVFLICLFVILSSLQYVFLYFRASVADLNIEYTEVPLNPSISQFIEYISGGGFVKGESSYVKKYDLSEIFALRVPKFLELLNENFNPFGLILVFAGFFYCFFIGKEYKMLSFLVLALLGELAFAISYDVIDITVFYLPIYLIFAVFAALIFANKQQFYPALIFLIVIYINVFHNNTFKKISNPPVVNFSQIDQSVDYYDKSDFPLFYPYYQNYYTKSYVNYQTIYGAFDSKRKFIDNISETVSEKIFYSFGKDYPLFTDTALFSIQIAKETKITEYVKSKVDSGKVIFISVLDEASNNMPANFKDYIKGIGGTVDRIGWRGSYAGVIYQNRICDKANNVNNVKLAYDNGFCDPTDGKLEYDIVSAGLDFGNKCSFEVGSNYYQSYSRGVNVLVYDLEQNRATELMNFDTHLGDVNQLFLIKRK